MQRGDLYLVKRPGSQDPKKQRVFVVVSRQLLIDSKFSTVICAPVYSRHDGLSTQVQIGIGEGLKHESSVHCDELVSLPKSSLTRFIGRIDSLTREKLNLALARALALEN
jgi:mRNA interferase MazF